MEKFFCSAASFRSSDTKASRHKFPFFPLPLVCIVIHLLLFSSLETSPGYYFPSLQLSIPIIAGTISFSPTFYFLYHSYRQPVGETVQLLQCTCRRDSFNPRLPFSGVLTTLERKMRNTALKDSSSAALQ